MEKILTASEGNFHEFFPPLFGDFHNSQVIVFVSHVKTIVACLSDQRLHVLGVNRVDDVEKVVSVRQTTFREATWKEDSDFLVFFEVWPEFYDAELVISWDFYPRDFAKFQQLFFFRKNLSKKIFVDHCVRRQVELH